MKNFFKNLISICLIVQLTFLDAHMLTMNGMAIQQPKIQCINLEINLPSIFLDEEKNLLVFLDTILKLNLDEHDLNEFLEYIKNYSKERGKYEIYLKVVAGLMFKKYYSYLGEIIGFEILSGGLDSEKPVEIITTKGKYVWKAVNNYKDRGNLKKAKFIVSFNLHLSAKRIPVAKFLPNVEDNYLVKVGDTYYALSKFIEEGRIISGKNYQLQHHKARGRLAAQIQNVTMDLESTITLEEKTYTDRVSEKLDSILDKIKRNETEGFPFPDIDIEEQIRLYREHFETLHKDWVVSYIHRDLNPGNIFFGKNGITGLVDFANACYDYRIVEFVRIILGGSFRSMETTYNKKNLENVIVGYQREAKKQLNTYEIRGIIEVIRLKFLWLIQFPKMRQLFVNESFKRFVEDFTTEEKISDFINNIQNRLESESPKTFDGDIQITPIKAIVYAS